MSQPAPAQSQNPQSPLATAIGRACWVVLLLLTCSACTDGDNGDGQSEPPPPPPAEPDPTAVEIEAATGARTRLVWMRFTRTDISDVYGNFENFQLYGIDTGDTLGERPILEDKGNYSRPLLTHDGETIVFTRKHTERDGSKKTFRPEIFRVDWQGENFERLGEGYAVDLWRDPETGVDWVYCADLDPSDQSNLYASRIERFQLIDPFEREVVFDKSQVSPDNVQLSRDGRRMSCQFPWPKVGAVDLETGERWQNQHGCWPSMAPDNSYAAWVFDGGHKSVHVFGDRGVKHAQVSFAEAPGIGSFEMYHPRWSNHVEYFTVTGPYKGRTIGAAGHTAEILLGKFSSDLKSVDAWVQVTDNDVGDFFPDAWIEGGDTASLDPDLFQGDKVPPSDVTHETEWPFDNDHLLFVWENASPEAQRMVGARPADDVRGHECSVTPRERARFGRHFEMLADGGYFEVDGESSVLIDQHLEKEPTDPGKEGHGFAFEAWVTPASVEDGVIFSHPRFQLRQNNGEYRFAALAPKPATLTLGPVIANESLHLAISFNEEGWWIYRDGRGRTDKEAVLSAEPMANIRGTSIGGSWDGSLEGVAIYDRALTAEEIAHNRAHFKKVQAERAKAAEKVATLKVKARLVEATAPRSVDDLAYASALIANRYQVVEMISGELPDKEFVVYHWAVMDRKALAAVPGTVGDTYELEIEAYEHHPEIVSQLRWSDFFEAAHDLYYDVAPPGPYADK